MPRKPKNNKIRIKINDKKITNYMFDFTRTIIFVFAIISVAFTFIIRDANVVGNSMLDTLHSDDKIFITNFMYEPKCGDIVAINAENQIEKRIIKRVIAVEGQTLVVDYSKNHLTAKAELSAVGEAGGAVDVDGGTVHCRREEGGVGVGPGQDGFAVQKASVLRIKIVFLKFAHLKFPIAILFKQGTQAEADPLLFFQKHFFRFHSNSTPFLF